MAVSKPAGVMTYPAHRLRGESVVSRAVHHLPVSAAGVEGPFPYSSGSTPAVAPGYLRCGCVDVVAVEPIAVHRLDLGRPGFYSWRRTSAWRRSCKRSSKLGVRKTYWRCARCWRTRRRTGRRAPRGRRRGHRRDSDADADGVMWMQRASACSTSRTSTTTSGNDGNPDEDATRTRTDELDELDEPGVVRVVNAAIGDPEPGRRRSAAPPGSDGGRWPEPSRPTANPRGPVPVPELARVTR